MRRIRNRQPTALSLPSLRLEGSLLLPDQLEKAALGKADHQSEADYHTPKGLRLRDDYSRAFQIASAQWKHFATLLEREDADPARVTTTFVTELLRDAFGYQNLYAVEGFALSDRHYPVTLAVGSVTVVVAPHNLGLDDLDSRFAVVGGGSRKKSAFQLAQEFLNASPDHLWALVSNGRQLRLLRDAATLTRPSFLEFDLQDLLGGQRFAEFAMAWRLLHASRAGDPPEECIWEAWRSTGQEEGTRVREGLRVGVTQALLTLGSGFLLHPANEDLRRDLQEGQLTKEVYFEQLLRLIYRLIFLFTVEERGLLHPADDSKSAVAARLAYAEGYALARLRDRSLRRRARTRFDDLWQGVRIVFKGLGAGQPGLALPALGGLFAGSQCPALDAASLSNANLLEGIKHLRWDNSTGTLAPVDYRNMGPEELGSVYESLLELVPEVDVPARQFGFAGLTSESSTQGNARKTSGSYYTPDSLVQELIKSALDPVIEQRLANHPENPTEALLNIKVIDPACGSGHFLLAAARRLAEQLAVLRSPEGAVKPQDYRHALREVISRCIFGVDRNHLALELCCTALWLEGFEEGRPLSFLDHHLQCGDALLGLSDLKALEVGIPAAAFKPLSGDDKETCKQLVKDNKAGLNALEKQRKHPNFSLDLESASGLSELQALEALPENTPTDIAAREAAYEDFLREAKNSRVAHAADLLLGAFVLPKTEATATQVPTSQTLYLELFSDARSTQHQQQLDAAREACAEVNVLHWPLAFPQVFKQGGFDCVLGNPPWERIKLQEEEFFATRNPLVAEAKNKAERSQRIDWLAQGQLARHLFPEQAHSEKVSDAEQRLYREFLSARRAAEAVSVFAHLKGEEGGRYPLTGVGDVNTYALFAETIKRIVNPNGRAGFIVPSGLATDNSTKEYFGEIVSNRTLESFYEFENVGFFSGAGQGHMLRFALVTLLGAAQEVGETRFLFQGKRIEVLDDNERVFSLAPEDIARVNPNTLTCPIFQSQSDAELTKKIYQSVPVLVQESRGDEPERNPWSIRFMTMFHMSNDSHLFETRDQLEDRGYELDGNRFTKKTDSFLPLYEAKMVYSYNHRHGDFSETSGARAHVLPRMSNDKLRDATYFPIPFYWVSEAEVSMRLRDKDWAMEWLVGFRDVSDARASVRSFISTVIPKSGVNNKFPLLLSNEPADKVAALVGNISALCFDFVTRQKLGGLTLNFFIVKQLPVLPPQAYTKTDLAFIVPRVLELTYTSWDLQPWARDLGYSGEPFSYDLDRRASLSAELDAWYARAYGLTRTDLRYILDPADVLGDDYPSETFRVLKNHEMKEFGEYRTQRLVLDAWDSLQNGDLH